MNENAIPNRRARRAAASTGAVDPAIEAAAERAAIERDPADTATVPAVEGALPAADLPSDAVAVMPEPTLVAEPGAPMPIVTASPILAVEPSAIDVVHADAAADRVAAGIEPAPAGDAPHLAAAGQPTLTIEGATAAGVARTLADGALFDTSGTGGGYTGFPEGEDVFDQGKGWPERDSLDDLIDDLRVIMRSDPDACARILDQLLPHGQPIAGVASVTRSDRPTVTVVEVVGPPAGRRRAGMTFGAEAKRFRASVLSADALAALHADPLLAVGVSEVDEVDEAFAPALAG